MQGNWQEAELRLSEVYVREEQDKDAEEWRQLFLVMENPEKTPVFSAEQESLSNFLGEEWVGTDELLRSLLGKEYPLRRWEICEEASSNATSSSAQPCEMPAQNLLPMNASSSEISLDTLDFFEALHQEQEERHNA